MTLNGWLQIALFIALILLLAKPMGAYMTRVYERRRTWLDPVLVPCERLLYRVTGIDPDHEMRWTEYAVAMLIFTAATILLTYAIQRMQHFLPLNLQHFTAVAPDLAMNTAISFSTNTNWQSYTPETTMSYLTQIAGREKKTLGNFWVDMTRSTLWILLPISAIFALTLVSQGVIQNFRAYDTATLVQPQTSTTTGAAETVPHRLDQRRGRRAGGERGDRQSTNTRHEGLGRGIVDRERARPLHRHAPDDVDERFGAERHRQR